MFKKACVNALLRAYSISTYHDRTVDDIFNVSMPFFGLTPFLLKAELTQHEQDLMCQCPSSGLLHFYVIKTDAYKRVEECVNALLRAYSISTKITKSNSGNQTMCQCPSSGLLHFYGTLWEPSVYAASQTHFCK